MAARKRVLIAGLYHETNTFLEGRTRLEDFQFRPGPRMLDSAGDSSPLAGAVESAARFGWEAVPAIDMRAAPGPLVEDRVVAEFWNFMLNAIAEAGSLEGVLLILHGAMVSESFEDVEGELLERLRQLPAVRDIPICGVLDLHANVTAGMALHSSGLIAYRENPHTDAKETAVRAAELLERLLATGEHPATHWKHAGVMWPATGTGAADEPVLSLERKAREIERSHPEILAVNVFPGFGYADVADAGVSFTIVTTGGAEDAGIELDRLVAEARLNRSAGDCAGLPIEEAIRQLKQQKEGPVLLVEPADNIGAGTSGRGTAVLKALLDHGIGNAAVVIQAPEVVADLAGHKPGSRLKVILDGPLHLDVELVSTSNGKFTLEDPHSHLASMTGRQIDMGRCAVVRCAGVRILLTSRKTPPFDLGQLRSQGIAPEEQFVIGVKAAVAHKRAYDPIAKASYTLDTPGPCAANLRRLSYRRVRRPVYPLDS